MSNKRKVKKAPTVPTGLPGESPWPKRLGWMAGIGLVVALVAVVFLSQPALRGVPEGTEIIAVTTNLHIQETIYAPFEVPAGGDMDAAWQSCGYYGAPVRAENVMHSLEHGAVWVTYDPDLAESDIGVLRGFVGRSNKVIVSPVAGQNGPIIATAWGRQLLIDNVSDSRLGQFVNEFSGSLNAPEPGGRCSGGIGQPQFS